MREKLSGLSSLIIEKEDRGMYLSMVEESIEEFKTIS